MVSIRLGPLVLFQIMSFVIKISQKDKCFFRVIVLVLAKWRKCSGIVLMGWSHLNSCRGFDDDWCVLNVMLNHDRTLARILLVMPAGINFSSNLLQVKKMVFALTCVIANAYTDFFLLTAICLWNLHELSYTGVNTVCHTIRASLCECMYCNSHITKVSE